MAAEEKYLCPSCGKAEMVKKQSKPGWHILQCQGCGAQEGPIRDRVRQIDVA